VVRRSSSYSSRRTSEAKVSLDDAEGAFESTPMLRQLIKERKREELVLTNGITLEVRAQRFAAFAAQLALQ